MGEHGERSAYSSVGPTYDERVKPDVMAPGTNVISSYSSYYLEACPEASDIASDVEHFEFNGRTYAWNANSGTSMSSPVVAGIIALWLEAKPTLSRDDVMEVIRESDLDFGRVYSELPTLNDVFLTITGKELRDKDERQEEPTAKKKKKA
jgi:subtilisin family serine protease